MPTDFRGEQYPFRVHPVQDLLESGALLPHEPPPFDRKIVVDDLAARHRIATHLADRSDLHVCRIEVCQEQAQPAEAIVRRRLRRAGEQQHHLALECFRRPDLATADAPPVAVGDGPARDPARVGSCVGLGDAERDVQLTSRSSRQERLPQTVIAELHHGVEPEHGEMNRRASVHRRSARRDLVQHDGCLGDPFAPTAVQLRQGDAHPPACGEGVVELPREPVLAVAVPPVRVVEQGAHGPHTVGDQFVVCVESRLHAPILSLRRRQRPPPSATRDEPRRGP